MIILIAKIESMNVLIEDDYLRFKDLHKEII